MLKLLDWVLDKLPGPAVVYLSALVVGIQGALDVIPADTWGAEGVSEWALRIAAGLAGLVALIRRTTEVPAMARGLTLRKGLTLTVRADDEVTGQGDVLQKAA